MALSSPFQLVDSANPRNSRFQCPDGRLKLGTYFIFNFRGKAHINVAFRGTHSFSDMWSDLANAETEALENLDDTFQARIGDVQSYFLPNTGAGNISETFTFLQPGVLYQTEDGIKVVQREDDLKVGKGFLNHMYQFYDAIKERINQAADDNKPFNLTGHSLGSIACQLFGYVYYMDRAHEIYKDLQEGRPTPSTRCCLCSCVGSMAWRATKVHAMT